ncbi:cytochrome P450 4V2-like [Photinus pyralis]|nr:cytochrome P450 4V2-like [Photinus pyralis]
MYLYILITAICLTLLMLLIIQWFRDYYTNEKYLDWINGARPLPVLGNALEFISGDVISEFYRLHQQHGPIIKILLPFQPPNVSVTDHALLETIFRSAALLNKSNDYRFTHPWLGHGLLTAPGERWKKHRKLIAPAFSFEKSQYFIDIFEKHSCVLLEKLSKKVGEGTVNIYPYINLCTLDIICEAAMGTTINAQSNDKSDYVYSVKEMCRIVIGRSLSIPKSFDFLYQFTKDFYKQNKALKILHEYSRNVIEFRKKVLLGSSEQASSNTLLDLLLDSKETKVGISDSEIREEVDTFMFAGHDTVTSAISFILYCLAMHPQVQERVVKEMEAILWSHNLNVATYGRLQKLRYLEAVIKETLRLYPSVPIYCRRVVEDLHFGDQVIPANTTIVIFAYGVHRCPKTYPEPEKFDPNRFLTENQSAASTSSYIPFSAGYRSCIGKKFAMLEMKVVVSKILKHYRLLPTVPEHKLILKGETVLKSKNGVCIRLAKRFNIRRSDIPRNTSLLICIYGIHRSEEFYQDPEKFIPERFFNPSKVAGSYLPFSAGPRNCIGQKFAMFEMKYVLVTLLKHYEILPATPRHEPKLADEVVLVSLNGVRIAIRERKL